MKVFHQYNALGSKYPDKNDLYASKHALVFFKNSRIGYNFSLKRLIRRFCWKKNLIHFI